LDSGRDGSLELRPKSDLFQTLLGTALVIPRKSLRETVDQLFLIKTFHALAERYPARESIDLYIHKNRLLAGKPGYRLDDPVSICLSPRKPLYLMLLYLSPDGISSIFPNRNQGPGSFHVSKPICTEELMGWISLEPPAGIRALILIGTEKAPLLSPESFVYEVGTDFCYYPMVPEGEDVMGAGSKGALDFAVACIRGLEKSERGFCSLEVLRVREKE